MDNNKLKFGLLVLSVCINSLQTLIINVDCDRNYISEDSEETDFSICHIGEHIRLAEHDELNIRNAAQYNDTTYFIMTDKSNATIIPAVIFDKFHNLKRIRQSTGITLLPLDIFQSAQQLEMLELGKNRLEKLPSRVFVGARNLQEIDLSGNRITEINDFAFDALTKLEFLFLFGNKLKTLKRHAFSGCGGLKSLQLEENEIETIEDGALNLPHLKSIFLGNNKLTTLSDHTFSEAPNLYGIDLKSNQLTHIGQSLYRCIKLGGLILDNNRIDDISLSRFAAMPILLQLSMKNSGFNFTMDHSNTVNTLDKSSMRFLDISSNRIVDANVLSRLAHQFGNLEELNLEYNELVDIADTQNIQNYFPRMSVFELSGNKLNCNRIREFIAYFRRLQIRIPRTEDPFTSKLPNVNGIVCVR